MTGAMIGTIVILVLTLSLVGIGFYAYRTIRRKVRHFAKMAFGTETLSQGIGQVESEYASTPKSISAATSLYLPQIMKDFPDFHYDEMKERAENVLLSYHRSLEARNVALLTEGTDELKDRLGMEIEMQRSQNEKVHFSQMKIHRTEIARYRNQKGRCSIIFQSAIEYYYYKEKDGNVLAGSKNTKTQAKYDVECIYIQDRDLIEDTRDYALGVNCPNCGAPLSGVGAKVCAYCDTPIVEFNIRAWNFSDIKRV